MYPRMNGKWKTFSFICYPMISLILVSFLWGCAGKAQKVLIEDTATTVEQGTIISAKTGRSVTFDELVKDLNRSQIVFVGEQHTNHSHHGIQLKIIQDVFKNNPSMRVGMEMFDRSYQQVLELWSVGVLEEDAFLRKVHWYANWRYDFALYRDIIEIMPKRYLSSIILKAALNLTIFIWPSAYGMKSWRNRLLLIWAQNKSLFWRATVIFNSNTVYRIGPFAAPVSHFERYTWHQRGRRLSWGWRIISG